MYRTGTFRREMGMRSGPYTGGAVLVPWRAITLGTRRKLLARRPIAHERPRIKTWLLFVVAAIATFGLVAISGTGFGQVDHVGLIQSRPHAIMYALTLMGALLATVALARRLFSAGSWLPWERAVLTLDAIEVTPRGARRPALWRRAGCFLRKRRARNPVRGRLDVPHRCTRRRANRARALRGRVDARARVVER